MVHSLTADATSQVSLWHLILLINAEESWNVNSTAVEHDVRDRGGIIFYNKSHHKLQKYSKPEQ